MSAGEDTGLPPDWIRKPSRRCPTATYYFNTKTGKSTWIHPKLIEWSNENGAGSENTSDTKKGKKKEKSQKKAFSFKGKEERDEVTTSPEPSIPTEAKTPTSPSPKKRRKKKGPSEAKPEVSPVNQESPLIKKEPVKFAVKTIKNATISRKPEIFVPRTVKSIGPHPSILKARKRVSDNLNDGNNNDQSSSVSSSTSSGLKLISQSYDTEEGPKAEPPPESNKRILFRGKRKGKGKKEPDKDLIDKIIKEINNSIPENKKYGSPHAEPEHNHEKKRDSNFTTPQKSKDTNERLPEVEKYRIPRRKAQDESLEARDSESKESPSQPCDIHHDEVIAMEIDEQEIITEIASFRGSVNHAALAEDKFFSFTNVSNSSEAIYFVVDTNVLIQDIALLESLKANTIGGRETVIVIPYTALQEMDGLKKKESIGKACQAAIRWCHQHFEVADCRVQGQSYQNYLASFTIAQGASGDDLIRDCCLQLQKEGLDTCLLSNDINLRNKAFMANISAVGIKKLRSQLSHAQPTSRRTQQPSHNHSRHTQQSPHNHAQPTNQHTPQSSHNELTNQCTVQSSPKELNYQHTQHHSHNDSRTEHTPTTSRRSLADNDCQMRNVRELKNSDAFPSRHQSRNLNEPMTWVRNNTNVNLRDSFSSKHLDSKPQAKRSKTRKSGHKLSFDEEQLLKKIVASLHHTLSSILEYIMKDIYEELWLTILKHKPPWSLRELFVCWEKHWIAAMTDKFSKDVKKLLEEINKTWQQCESGMGNVKQLLSLVKSLYRFFDSRYRSHILPIQERPTTPASPPPSSPTPPLIDTTGEGGGEGGRLNNTLADNHPQEQFSEGVNNVKNMINLVGVHLTHYIALVLNVFGVIHNLPTLSSGQVVSREEAHVSAVNLHKVTLNLGNALFRCIDEGNQNTVIDLCHQLVNFWSAAGESCPDLPFTDADLTDLLNSQHGRLYLTAIVTELERLINLIIPVIQGT